MRTNRLWAIEPHPLDATKSLCSPPRATTRLQISTPHASFQPPPRPSALAPPTPTRLAPKSLENTPSHIAAQPSAAASSPPSNRRHPQIQNDQDPKSERKSKIRPIAPPGIAHRPQLPRIRQQLDAR